MNYKLVPLEPTPEMEAAYKNGDGTHVGLYRAMIEAAPAAPVELEPVAYMAPTGTCVKAGYVSYTPNWTDYYTTPLVSQSAAAAVIAKLMQERDKSAYLLGSLLSVIHRDGGHHAFEVGNPKAVQDAMDIYYKLHEEIDTLTASGHRLSLELECLLSDCKDMAIVSKWSDSAMEAVSDWQDLFPYNGPRLGD